MDWNPLKNHQADTHTHSHMTTPPTQQILTLYYGQIPWEICVCHQQAHLGICGSRLQVEFSMHSILIVEVCTMGFHLIKMGFPWNLLLILMQCCS